MSGLKFKFKVKQTDGAASAPVPTLGNAPHIGPAAPAQPSPAFNGASMGGGQPHLGGLRPAGAPGEPIKRKRADELGQPSSLHAEPPQAKRQHQDAMPAASAGGSQGTIGGTKVRLTFKKPSGLNTAPSQGSIPMGLSAQLGAYNSPAIASPPATGQTILQSMGLTSAASHGLPLPARQRPNNMMAGGGVDKNLAKAQQKKHDAEQKAQEKVQAALAKQQEKEAKQQAEEQQNQLNAIMSKTFKLKIKVKQPPSGPAPQAPGPPAPPGMVPLPSRPMASPVAAQPAARVRVKVLAPGARKPPRAPLQDDGMHAAVQHHHPPQRAAHAAPAYPLQNPSVSSYLDATATIQGMQNMLNSVHEPLQPTHAGMKRPKGRAPGSAVAAHRPAPAQRPAAARPAVHKRPKVVDPDDYDTEDDDDDEEYVHKRAQPRAPPRMDAAAIATYMDKVLEGVAKKDEGQGNVFKAPVTDEVAPGYSEKIQNPMCFDVMRGKLKSGLYPTWDRFEADLALVFSNAQTFNAPGSFVYHHANYLRDVGKKYLIEAKKGNTNFRGVAAGITRKYISEWAKAHPVNKQLPPERLTRPFAQARTNSVGSLELVEQQAARPSEVRQARGPSGASAAARERHKLAAAEPNYGRGHRQHANVSYAAELGPEPGKQGRGSGGRGSRGAHGGRGSGALMRTVRAGDPDAKKMAAVYVRRNEAEELRDTYHLAVPPNAIPLAMWRGLAAGATAEGADFAAGAFAVRPMWPGALYPNLPAAVQAHTQGGASFAGAGLPQDAYVRSVARFVRRCHPAVRRMVVASRLASCVAVEGAPDPPPLVKVESVAPVPAGPASTSSGGAPAGPGSAGQLSMLQPAGMGLLTPPGLLSMQSAGGLLAQRGLLPKPHLAPGSHAPGGVLQPPQQAGAGAGAAVQQQQAGAGAGAAVQQQQAAAAQQQLQQQAAQQLQLLQQQQALALQQQQAAAAQQQQQQQQQIPAHPQQPHKLTVQLAAPQQVGLAVQSPSTAVRPAAPGPVLQLDAGGPPAQAPAAGQMGAAPMELGSAAAQQQAQQQAQQPPAPAAEVVPEEEEPSGSPLPDLPPATP